MTDMASTVGETEEVERAVLEVDIACVGFGPATGGFLSTIAPHLTNEDGTPAFESKTMPGMPLQILCYERADDPGFGVSGVVTRGRAIRATFPDFNPEEIPHTARVTEERLLYLLDPVGASRRTGTLRLADRMIRMLKGVVPFSDEALKLPFIPDFLQKHDGFVLSLGQFNQWVAGQLMMSGAVQLWPGTPVEKALVEGKKVTGIRLADQGVDSTGKPDAGFMPGMDIKAALTVVGDGPVGPVGRQIDEQIGVPEKHEQQDWAVGMKMVIDLPEGCDLAPGTVFHTFGYPEPEIFGFFYVYPDGVASVGIFVPATLENPVRSTYRYMQHWMQHPAIWKHIDGGKMRSWGAKTLHESGMAAEPYLAGDGYARIGEGSGSTNVLTGSGVDEAWMTGTLLAEGVLQLLKEGREFTRENLEETYVKKRRESWVGEEGRVAEKARHGFQKGFVRGMLGMALSAYSKGRMNLSGDGRRATDRVPSLEEYAGKRISAEDLQALREECRKKGASLHDAVMNRMGWPEIQYDGQLLMSHQDALLTGGKVQAAPGYADHVTFLYPHVCDQCGVQVCVEMCSGQAISTNPEGGVPLFDREKCVHCGACVWNCGEADPENPEASVVRFNAGAGGLHSAEN